MRSISVTFHLFERITFTLPISQFADPYPMRSSILFWTLAALLTIGSAIYQRLTGPTYPLRGDVLVGETVLHYTMERSYSSSMDAPVFVEVPDSGFSGVVRWKYRGTDGPWNEIPMVFVGGTVRAEIPTQVPLTKLDYSVEIRRDSTAKGTIPGEGSIPIRFKGDVPLWVIIPHVIAMFLSMLYSTRAGLEVFAKEPSFRNLTAWTVGMLLIGGFIFGPLMTFYAFGEWWTGWPLGNDVTDSKTLVALIGWMVPVALLNRPAYLKWGILFAALVMFGVFLIPHSV